MKVKLLVILVFIILILASCSFIKRNEISHLRNDIQDLREKNERLIRQLSELQETNNNLKESLNKKICTNKRLTNALEQNKKSVKYLDTIVEGKETFTTYENLIKNFGNPKEVRNIIDKYNVYNHGHFVILVFDDIEFVVDCSGNENDPFFIKDHDSVCRVDITGDKYILNRSYFKGIKIGDSVQEIVKYYDKEINDINYKDYYETHMDIVVNTLRNDVENYRYKRGIYFSGEMDTGIALGIVLLIDDNNKVARIIMGWPTAG